MDLTAVRPGFQPYPFPEVGAPDVITTIDPDVMRPKTALYSFPSTEGPVDNTVGLVIIYGKPT